FAEGTETVELDLNPVQSYIVDPTQDHAVVSITDDSTDTAPVVSIAATDPTASEAGLDPAQFTVSRTGNTAAPLTVASRIDGSATNGEDYVALSGSVEIAAGAASAPIDILPLTDNLVEGNESVTLSLLPDPNGIYDVSAADSASATLFDALPVVTIDATQP